MPLYLFPLFFHSFCSVWLFCCFCKVLSLPAQTAESRKCLPQELNWIPVPFVTEETWSIAGHLKWRQYVAGQTMLASKTLALHQVVSVFVLNLSLSTIKSSLEIPLPETEEWTNNAAAWFKDPGQGLGIRGRAASKQYPLNQQYPYQSYRNEEEKGIKDAWSIADITMAVQLSAVLIMRRIGAPPMPGRHRNGQIIRRPGIGITLLLLYFFFAWTVITETQI